MSRQYRTDPEWIAQQEILKNPPGDTAAARLIASLDSARRVFEIEERYQTQADHADLGLADTSPNEVGGDV